LVVHSALDGLPLFVGGGLTEQLGTGRDVLGDRADLINRTPSGFLDLAGSLSCGVLDPLGGLPDLIGHALEGAALALPLLLILSAFTHLFSLRHNKSNRLAP
jgi:hypothetical protein